MEIVPKVKRYFGIGPRKTPPQILNLMTEIARQMGESGWVVQSGNARGADTAFQAGAILGGGKVVSYVGELPRNPMGEVDYRVIDENLYDFPMWKNIARKHHPGFDRVDPYIQGLFIRNVPIVLAENPMFGIYWQPKGNNIGTRGGTNHSLRIAKAFNIPTYNLGIQEEIDALIQLVNRIDNES